MELYKYQKDGVDFLISRKHTLLADDMGLGKTVQAIKASLILIASGKVKNKILVICPASVKLNWRKEWLKWSGVESDIIKKRSDVLQLKEVVTIINYEMLIKDEVIKALKQRSYGICIVDEAHYLKSKGSKRTRAVLGRNGIIKHCTYKMLLTGTPVLNRPVELFPILKTLFSEQIKDYPDYISFIYQYCGAYQTHFGIDCKGASHIKELKAKLQNIMLRRTKDEVNLELPNKVVTHIPLQASSKVLALEKDLGSTKDQIIKYIVGNENAVLGEMATVRRKLSEFKTKQVVTYIKDLLEDVDKLVVFTYHRNMLSKIAEVFKNVGVSIVQGGMSADAKQQNIDDFQGENRVFLGQINSAGVGIDGLQRVCNQVLFAEYSWTPADLWQAEDRLCRIGQESDTVFIQYLYYANTLEETILNTLNKKRKIIGKILT